MFLRGHRRIKDGKEHRYYTIAENRRLQSGNNPVEPVGYEENQRVNATVDDTRRHEKPRFRMGLSTATDTGVSYRAELALPADWA